MKKISIVLLVMLLCAGTVFAATGAFSDENNFPEWAKSSINRMKNSGVIEGYADGTFKANNSISRGELAVMLDRFQSNNVFAREQMVGILTDFADLQQQGYEPEVVSAVTMARAGYNLMNSGDPKAECTQTVSEWVLLDSPQSYKVYYCNNLIRPYYVHNFDENFVAPESDGAVLLNNWYGPYYSNILPIE